MIRAVRGARICRRCCRREKAAPIAGGGDLVRCCALADLLRQFNRKTCHAAGQGYGDASHRCCVQMVSSRIHLGPSSDDSGEEQHGNSDNGEYMAHGSPLSRQCVGIGPIAPRRCDGRHKLPLFVDFH